MRGGGESCSRPRRLRPSPDWLKMKNPACAAVTREAEDEWALKPPSAIRPRRWPRGRSRSCARSIDDRLRRMLPERWAAVITRRAAITLMADHAPTLYAVQLTNP